MPPLPKETRNLYAAVGAMLLVIGFGAGYVTGTERARYAAGAASLATLPSAPHAHAHGGPSGAAGMPPPPRGHTFTGKVDVPPHGDVGHELAAKILGEVACPCGGCSDMSLLECGCDLAKEAEGIAAHLFERGKTGAQVLAQLSERYRFEVPPSVLARVGSVGSGAPSTAPEPAPAGLSGMLEGISRPLDIPTSARPKP